MKTNLFTRVLFVVGIVFSFSSHMGAQEQETKAFGVGLNYFMEHVAEPIRQNWQLVQIEGTFKIKSPRETWSWVLVPHLNLAQRTGGGISFFDHTALQGQLDAYLKVSHKVSLSGGYGYSNSDRFARHQAALELNYSLTKGWGITGGTKLTTWDKTAMTYLIEVEKYIGNFWLTLRPMVVFQDGKAFFAARTGARYYLSSSSNFLHLGVFYGNSPEYANYLPDLRDLLSLGSWGAFFNWQQSLNKSITVRAGISYRKEEYKYKSWRNVVGLNAGLTYNF